MEIGIQTRHGCKELSFGFCSSKGPVRPDNQDVLVIIPDMILAFPSLCSQHSCTESPFAFFGVFDGHGGVEAALFAERYLPEMLLYLYLRGPPGATDLTDVLITAIRHLDNEYLATGNLDGTTALVVLITPQGRLISCNIGDSDGFIAWSSGRVDTLCPLGRHNPSKNSAEAQRILMAGGSLFNGRVVHPVQGTARTIAVSRAIGDASFKPKGTSLLISTPDIMDRHLTGEETFLVLACDGLWDVFDLEDAALFLSPLLEESEMIGEHPPDWNSLDVAAERLVNTAIQRGSTDNTSVILIKLS